MTLKEFFEQVPKAAAAFSGGTDSAFVLWAAKEYGCDVHAYYVKTAFQPAFELEDARHLAEELDIPMTVVDMDILSFLRQRKMDRSGAITVNVRFLHACGKRQRTMVILYFWMERMLRMMRETVRA